MSKKAKNAARLKRLNSKRATKEAQRRRYESYAAEGNNSLSKRAKAAKKGEESS